ncbi:unnamed protein product [Urochloa humidicola]
MLKKVEVEIYVDDELSMSFSAPMVEQFEWCIAYEGMNAVFGQLWRLDSVCELRVQGQPPCVQIQLRTYPNMFQHCDFTAAMAHLLFPNFSVLELDIGPKGHVFGPVVLHLLQIRPVIQKLKISMENDWNAVNFPCPEDCPCKQPNNWRSESVPLTNLEVVEILDLQGKDHEVDFLKLLLQCATVLKRMSVWLVDGVSPWKILRIFKGYPDLEYVVYSKYDKGAKSKGSKMGEQSS